MHEDCTTNHEEEDVTPMEKTMLRAVAPLLVALRSAPAWAQTVCSQRTTFIQQLSGKYSESPVSMGLSSNGSVIEVLASATGSWTIIITNPNGLSCVVAHGEAWQDMPEVALGPAA